jgi:hypothetical protein
MFGLRNELVHHLFTPHFFIWFVKWIELIHHHPIPYSYLVSTNVSNEVIPPNLRNGYMMHHHILDGVIPQTKHSRSERLSICSSQADDLTRIVNERISRSSGNFVLCFRWKGLNIK